MSHWTDDELRLFRHRDWMQQMTVTPGWELMARWMQERIDDEIRGIENATDWADHQIRVGRLKTLREVLGKPGELVEQANDIERGDMNG